MFSRIVLAKHISLSIQYQETPTEQNRTVDLLANVIEFLDKIICTEICHKSVIIPNCHMLTMYAIRLDHMSYRPDLAACEIVHIIQLLTYVEVNMECY